MTSVSQPSVSSSARAARSDALVRQCARLGSFELVRHVGGGHLANVFLARTADSPQDQPPGYAVKVLRPEWQDDSRGLALLAREVQVSRQVTHPHLVPILAARLDEPPFYLVMPYLEGCSLAEALAAEPTLDLPLAFWIARQAAEAIEELERHGWMHADVKPSNLIVAPSGHATLVDLGLATKITDSRSIAERPIVGTLNYIAPEMLFSAYGGDARSDVYSLGVLLFQMLTGRLPFDAVDVAELAREHREQLQGDVRSLAPRVPMRAARLVRQMLSKEPLRRPSPCELVERLVKLEIETFGERCAGLDAA